MSCWRLFALTSPKPNKYELVLEIFDSYDWASSICIPIRRIIIQVYFIILIKSRMKPPQEPIQYSSIIQYYTSEAVLKRPRSELMKQMRDILTINDFLIRRIPSSMKNVKQIIRAHQRIIPKFIKQVKDKIKKIDDTMDKGGNRNDFNTAHAFNQIRQSWINKKKDEDFTEKTKAQLQMKLKFLQSQNLPSDFLWQRPQHQKNNNNFYSALNNKLHVLEIVAKKYRILVSFKVIHGQYAWNINQIQSRTHMNNQQYIAYFEKNLVPALQAKYGEQAENYKLYAIDHFSYFLDILSLNRSFCRTTGNSFWTDEISYNYKGLQVEMIFNKAQSFKEPLVTLIHKGEDIFTLELQFNKNTTKAIFRIEGMVELSTYNIKYENAVSLLNIFAALVSFGKKYIMLLGNMSQKIPDISSIVFINLNGVFWLTPNSNQSIKQFGRLINKDGIYLWMVLNIEGVTNNLLSYCGISSNGYLSSGKVSKVFLQSICKKASNVRCIFCFIFLIECFLKQSKQRELSLDCYSLDSESEIVTFIFRKKSNIEEQMTKIKAEQYEFKLVVQIDLALSYISIYSFLHNSQEKKMFQKIQIGADFGNLKKGLEKIKNYQQTLINRCIQLYYQDKKRFIAGQSQSNSASRNMPRQ